MVSTAWSRRIAATFVCLLLLGAAQSAHAVFDTNFQGLVQTLATGSLTLASPSGLIVDAAGNVFIADTGDNRIVEVNTQGIASVLAISGLTPGLSSPAGLAVDGSDNLYIADAGNNRVVLVSAAGAGSVIATGSVTLNSPKGVALDQSGDLFIADTINNRIVEVASGGAAAVLNITVSSGSATLSSPMGLAVNVSGTLYIADSGFNRIVTVAAGSTTGVVLSLNMSYVGSTNTLSSPSGVAVDRAGNVFIADTGGDHNRILEVDTTGTAFILAIGEETLNAPTSVALDVFGTIYIADTGNNRGLVVDQFIDESPYSVWYGRSINKSQVGFGHVALGASTGVTFTLPFDVEYDKPLGNPAVQVLSAGTSSLDFTFTTTCNNTIGPNTNGSDAPCSVQVTFLPTAPGLRKGAVVLYDTNQNALITIPVYGWGDAPVAALAPNTGTVISTGGLTTSDPYQLALDGAGNMYVGDYTGKNVTKVLAGGGSASLVNLGTPASTAVQNITGVALDGAGNLFIGDHQNSRVLVVTPTGVVSVLTITGLSPSLGFPTALQFDAAGNLFIADFTNGRIVEVSTIQVMGATASGVGTVIPTGGYSFGGSTLTGLAVDAQDNIYAAARTQNNNGIVEVTAAGAASVLAIPNNISPAIGNPQGVGVDGFGNIYIVDTGNSRIVEINNAGVASVLGLTVLTSPATLGSLDFGITVDPSGNLYIPDWTNNRIVFVNVSGGALTFPNTANGATSAPKTATVTNLGDQPLVFSANPTYTANFSANSSDENACTLSTSLLAGMACDVSVEFTPQSVGSLSAGITVTNNTLNIAGSTEQVSVSGTSFNSADSTSTTVGISPTPLANGEAATLTATVSDTTAGHSANIPTGSVTFIDTVGTNTTTLNSGAPVPLTGGVARLSGVVLSGIGTHTVTAAYSGVSGSYATSSGTVTTALSLASVTVAGPTTVAVKAGQTGSATITVTGPYSTIAAPSGTITYSILSGSGTVVGPATLTLTAGSGSSTATIPIPNTLASGSYTINVIYQGDSNYAVPSTATTIQLQISQIAPTISWSPAATAMLYGSTLNGVLNASAQNGTSTVPGSFVYTAAPAGGAAATVASSTVLGAGSYTLTVTFTPTNTTEYTTATSTVTLIVSQDTPTVSLVSSASPVLITSAVTFTATAASAAGTPTGSVSFVDGTTLLGSVALSDGAASYTTSSLAAATHSITAVYSGSTNFAPATSSALAQLVQDFTLSVSGSNGSSPTQLADPGGTATYTLALGPSNGTTFPAPVTLSLSGLPPGATGTLTPDTLPAGSSLTNVTLSIQLPQVTAHLDRDQSPLRKIPPVVWGVLLLPFARRLRRAGKRMGKTLLLFVLLLAGIAAAAGLSGCGSSNGFFGQQQQSYTVTITATSGAVSHSTTVTLTVE